MADPVEVSEVTTFDGDSARKVVRFESFEKIEIPEGFSKGKLSIEGGVWVLEVISEAAVENKVGKAVSVRGATVAEPLATHEIFQEITDEEWEKYRRYEIDPEDPELGGWKPLLNGSAAMVKYHQKRLRGITDYYRPTVTVRVTEQGKGSVNLARLGKIDSPGVSISVPQSGNWLCIAIEGDDPGDGTEYAVSREYLASGPGGWDRELYGG